MVKLLLNATRQGTYYLSTCEFLSFHSPKGLGGLRSRSTLQYKLLMKQSLRTAFPSSSSTTKLQSSWFAANISRFARTCTLEWGGTAQYWVVGSSTFVFDLYQRYKETRSDPDLMRSEHPLRVQLFLHLTTKKHFFFSSSDRPKENQCPAT
mmetsp:Transcript_12388/g.24089  ORF Transcript_12388/g.24089 Transcript_12388/m.24089 type:complete len:151 (-) Transcript_12388:316-768(-)